MSPSDKKFYVGCVNAVRLVWLFKIESVVSLIGSWADSKGAFIDMMLREMKEKYPKLDITGYMVEEVNINGLKKDLDFFEDEHNKRTAPKVS